MIRIQIFLTRVFFMFQTAYVIGATLAILVCVLVYFGEGDYYTTYVIYSVTAAFGKEDFYFDTHFADVRDSECRTSEITFPFLRPKF